MRALKQGAYNSRTADKFVVRLPDGWRERVAEFARVNHRSMNSHILTYIEACLAVEESEQPLTQEALMEAFNKAEADPTHGMIMSTRCRFEVNDPCMYDGHLWVIKNFIAQDGVLWADLIRHDSRFATPFETTCKHVHLEPFNG